jgi:hypothetical protein
MNNDCIFSSDRKYRYLLKHVWDNNNKNEISWIGLNPSTADEKKLDPTLRKIKGFSNIYGFGSFWMLNLFALRSTDPAELYKDEFPVGSDNNKWILDITSKTNVVVCCWGSTGVFLDRYKKVLEILNPDKLYYINLTKSDQPNHPLYMSYKEEIKKAKIVNGMLERTNEILKKPESKEAILKW